jgi:hypothetical protein
MVRVLAISGRHSSPVLLASGLAQREAGDAEGKVDAYLS